MRRSATARRTVFATSTSQVHEAIGSLMQFDAKIAPRRGRGEGQSKLTQNEEKARIARRKAATTQAGHPRAQEARHGDSALVSTHSTCNSSQALCGPYIRANDGGGADDEGRAGGGLADDSSHRRQADRARAGGGACRTCGRLTVAGWWRSRPGTYFANYFCLHLFTLDLENRLLYTSDNTTETEVNSGGGGNEQERTGGPYSGAA